MKRERAKAKKAKMGRKKEEHFRLPESSIKTSPENKTTLTMTLPSIMSLTQFFLMETLEEKVKSC